MRPLGYLASLPHILGSVLPAIILVEDDPNDRFLFSRSYDRAALPNKLVVLADGEEAIAYLSGTPPFEDPNRDMPGIMFLDIKMPKISGFEVLAWLKERGSQLPVVMLSSSILDDAQKRALASLG